jgi:hypothetical protein
MQHRVDIAQDFLRLVMVVVFKVDDGAKLGGEVFAALIVLSLKLLDEKMVILVLVRRFIFGGVVTESGKR